MHFCERCIKVNNRFQIKTIVSFCICSLFYKQIISFLKQIMLFCEQVILSAHKEIWIFGVEDAARRYLTLFKDVLIRPQDESPFDSVRSLSSSGGCTHQILCKKGVIKKSPIAWEIQKRFAVAQTRFSWRPQRDSIPCCRTIYPSHI